MERLAVAKTVQAEKPAESQSAVREPAPESSGAAHLLLLQRKCACGNRTIDGDECTLCAKEKSSLQRKLTIGASNDPLEQEADRISDQILALPIHPPVNGAPSHIQRYVGRATESAYTAPASVDRVLASPGRPLEPALQQDMEHRFGHDFSRVRVHTGAAAEQSARDVSAHAYTVGHNLVFDSGRFASGTHEGRRLIAHELTHVVQQSGSDCYLARQSIGSPRTANVYSPEPTKISPHQTRLEPLRAIAHDFRAKVDADPAVVSGPSENVTDLGQNFWAVQIWVRINDLITADISAPLQNDFIELTRAVAQLDNPMIAERTKKITQNPAFKTDKKAQKLLYTDPDPRTGEELYNAWWFMHRTKKTLPNFTRYLTLPILNKITLWETQACGYTVGQVVDVHKSRGGTGKGTRNPKNAFFGKQLFVSSTAQRDTCLITPHAAVGDLVKYVPLQSIVDKMKIALDDGFVLYTHVLSGYGVGSQAPMTDCSTPEQRRKSQTQVTIKGEHYILIIGYESGKFLFWDAHASDSKEFGGGFGFLFFDVSHNRLSTAESDSDLPVDKDGVQRNGQHRYQPLNMSTK